MIVERRSLIKGLVALVAAPAIVKVASLMPVNAALQPSPLTIDDFVMRVLGPGLHKLADRVALDVLYGSLHMKPEWTIDQITRHHHAVSLFKEIDDQYRDQFGAQGVKIGDTLRIRLPNDYIVTDGPALDVTHMDDAFTYVTLESRRKPFPHEGAGFAIPAPLALAAAAVAVAPEVLKTPVTRRFWK